MNNQIFNKSPYKEFGTKSTYFAFFPVMESNGQQYAAVTVVDGKEQYVLMSYETIDGLIYALHDMKQRLELDRLKHGNAS